MVAQFRTTYDLWACDRAFQALLAPLRAGNSDFSRWWEAHDVRNATAGRKTLHHPRRGPRRFENASFQANDDPSLKLVIYTVAFANAALHGPRTVNELRAIVAASKSCRFVGSAHFQSYRRHDRCPDLTRQPADTNRARRRVIHRDGERRDALR